MIGEGRDDIQLHLTASALAAVHFELVGLFWLRTAIGKDGYSNEKWLKIRYA